ncbi:predicted protein [Naegleria gruberi]|uniref:RING-type E3 ubiquitin transferase n=1 Tax=Naegleria gruberi TaxID=5762 RepID=D2VP57_NAEGR|nr:uncharacterized protein NAEGRDRAFT_70739 [Naegleria gruberi]EFC41300.1 predicted protein [Naegleria gruberi]|eukprot:XP_002674044.1 predicted protein [Naegleria gruberi strain NEG-M]
MMNLHFIRRGLSPHQNQQHTSGSASNSQQSNNSKQTPNNSMSNTSNMNYSTNQHSNSSSSSCRKRTLEYSIDLDDLPSPPSLFSSASLIATMNAVTMMNTNETLKQSSPEDDQKASIENVIMSDDPNEEQQQEEEEIIISQTDDEPILKTQFPPFSIVTSLKKNDSLGDSESEDDGEYEDSNDEDELREFSIKQVEQSTKKRKLNIVNKEDNRKSEQLEDNSKPIMLLTQLPPMSTCEAKQEDITVVVEHPIDEEEFLNNATVPQENEMIKSLEDNIIEELAFTPDQENNIENLSQIPKLENNRQLEEDFDIHVDLHELDYEFSNNTEPAQKPEESIQAKKVLVDISVQTDNSLLPKPVQIVNSDPNNICSICLSAWSSTGLHQVCCLSCGHLFGKNCIEKWLKKNSTCPKCKKSADRSHIRLLYVDNIHAIDTQKVEDLESRLEAEVKARKELEVIKNGLELRIKMLLEQKGGENFAENPSSSPPNNKGVQHRSSSESDTNKRKSLIQRSLELAERKKKEFDLMNSEEEEVTRNIVCYNGKSKNQQSRKKNTYLYGSNGANKLLFNTPLENSGLIEISNNQVFISFERRDKMCGFYVAGLERLMSNPSIINQARKVMHNSPISDIKPLYLLSPNNSKGYSIEYMQSNLILTSSQDKSMRITDLRQGTADSICFFPYLSTNREGLSTSITCCEWNRTNSNYCFAGLSSGSILCYDTRKPSEPFLNTGDHSCSPHTMFHIPNKGLVVGSNNSITYYDENQYGYTKGHNLFNKEVSSFYFNTSNDTLLFTCRESSKSSQLHIFTLESNQHVNCLESISINHKGPKLGRPYVSDNGQNFLSTIAVPKPDDFSVEIWKSQTDQDYSFKGDIKLQSSTEIIQSCALSFNNLFVVTKDNLSAYLV